MQLIIRCILGNPLQLNHVESIRMNKGKSSGNPKLGEFMFATSQSPYIPFVATELHVGGSNISILVSQFHLSSTPDQCKHSIHHHHSLFL